MTATADICVRLRVHVRLIRIAFVCECARSMSLEINPALWCSAASHTYTRRHTICVCEAHFYKYNAKSHQYAHL